jgi:outer membrane biosynthesis protein TonB
MSKKSNKGNKQYNPQVKATEDITTEVEVSEVDTTEESVVETPEEDTVTTEVIEEEETTDVVTEEPIPVVEEPVVETIEEPTPEVVPEVTVKKVETPSPVKEPTKNASSSTVYQIVFATNATPLQVYKITKRLSDLSINYNYDTATGMIVGQKYSSFTEAKAAKKYFAGKGLKPIIKEI